MTINLERKDLQSYVEKLLFYYDLPGLAVGLGIHHGTENAKEVDLAGEFKVLTAGYKDYALKEPLRAENIFHMASVSKPFVGTSIFLLWERGLLDLDGRLTKYLPWFSMADSRYADITIRQMLSHTAGLPDVSDYGWETPETDEDALTRYVRSPEVKEGHLLWGPEENRFAYSNIGYETLGCVIAEITGMTFENFVEENIFKPLEMSNSTFLTFERDMEAVCTPHIKDEANRIVPAPCFPYNRAHGPSSTLTSNMEDMKKWAHAHLKKTLLKPETYEEAWKEHILVPNNGEQMCLSWFKRTQKGYTLYGHEGTDDGFRASFWMCPELDFHIAVSSNMSKSPVKRISKEIFDFLLR